MPGNSRNVFVIILILCVVLYTGSITFACTAVVLHGKDIIAARNFDWTNGQAFVVRHDRGVKKEADFLQDNDDDDFNSVQWVSKYGSITFDVVETSLLYGQISIPVDGINEKGFWVSSLWLDDNDGKTSSNIDFKKASINNWKLVEYLLDNCADVNDALKAIKNVQIINFNYADMSVNLHYIMADSSGNVAIVDILPDSKVIIHKNPEFDILTNNFYQLSLDNLKKYKGFGGELVLPKDAEANSENRFVEAAILYNDLKKYHKDSICDAFKIMRATAQNDLSELPYEGITQWTVGYDLTKKIIYWYSRTKDAKKFIKISDIDFSKPQKIKPLDINDVLVGNVTDYFKTGANSLPNKKHKFLFFLFNSISNDNR
ncbi:Choloylglycine hydrolase [Thermodesulfobium narugense DSM 14796]|uniref:Choloylglycine hydrolase n=1 Tax=Thermodesulfobium narugense DSM 14796 TaxID=747365 RepID=M1E466_9BACT|nr:linear amide C-N hydrolase [Thermodesulfobium narugense]AEE13752.1 Choloylglycine hydrolase [Thermodesulfobium narugense DSM 14796]